MIASVHLADLEPRAGLGLLRKRLHPGDIAGLRYGDIGIAAPIGGRLVPVPTPDRAGLIAFWDDDLALDGFLRHHPVAKRLSSGWHVRLEPIRASGSWSEIPRFPQDAAPMEDVEPVAVLTLGRLRLLRVVPFLRANAPASDMAARDPGMVASTAIARPPRLVATFSLWSTTAAMRAYAYGHNGLGHRAAIEAHRAEPFHHESLFARFRPYAAHGIWEGGEPLAAAVGGRR